jgi:hypothetical protein
MTSFLSVTTATKTGVVTLGIGMGLVLGSTVVVVYVSSLKKCESDPPFLLTVTKLVSILAWPTLGRAIREGSYKGACVIHINARTYTCIRWWSLEHLWLR